MKVRPVGAVLLQNSMKIRPVGAVLFHADCQRQDEANESLFGILRTRWKYANFGVIPGGKCINH